MTPALATTTDAICVWCARTYDPHELPAWEDFGVSPGYCSTECESAHGDQLERERRVVEGRERATYQRLHMLDPDWREHLTPVGDAARCRACTGVYLHAHPEFCSAECEADFMDALDRWADREDRFSDATVPAA